MNNIERLNLRMKPMSKTAWNSMLQKGFHLSSRAGLTVREFLQETIGYDDCFIDESVRTIFLNSSPVDDIDTVHIKDGDTLALGSAMPGLVGICMGRDNPYKEFRSGISSKSDDAMQAGGSVIRVFVKIFSTLAVDTGSDLLARGIEINPTDLVEFLERQEHNIVAKNENAPDILIEKARAFQNDVHVVVEFV